MDSEFLRHEACPKCGSSDNVGVWVDAYGNESKYCFTHGCDFSVNVGSHHQSLSLPNLNYSDLSNRGITKRTCVKYGVGVSEGKLYFPYYNNSKIVGAKWRDKHKDFNWIGANSQSLFGSQLFRKGGKQIIVTEGELDALAAYQMTRIPSVSVPHGSKGALKSIKQNLEYLESFKQVYICFDSDDAGIEATDEVMEVLKAGTAYRVNLIRKDACEYLMNDDAQSFKELIGQSQPKKLDAYYSVDKLHEQWLGYFSGGGEKGESFGIEPLDQLGVSMRMGELTSIYANPSVGKSTLVRQISANLLNRGKRVLVLAFEELPIKYFALIVGMKHGVKILSKEMSIQERETYFKSVVGQLFLSTVTGSTKIEELETLLEYSIRAEDIDYVIFDNITKYTACSYNQQAEIQRVLATLYTVSQKYKVHTLCVSHTSRSKDLEEGKAPNLFSGFNSGAIERFSDIVITMGRKLDSDVCEVAVRKDRNGNCVGECILYYDYQSGCFKGSDSKTVIPKPSATKQEVVVEPEKLSQHKKLSNCNGFPLATLHTKIEDLL